MRRKFVDARYLEASIPATHTPSFEIADGARVVPVNDLPEVAEAGTRFTVLGSGKTAVDACVWLLDNDVEPDQIRSVRPRDHWFHHRRHYQTLDLVGDNMEGISLDAQAGAEATDIEDLFDRLEASGRLVRIDPSAKATMYRITMLSPTELDQLRQIEDVVRLGHVERIERDRILLANGETETGPDVVHVDCTAQGLRSVPPVPVFQDGRIVLQQIRQNSPTFNSALIAFVEVHREDDAEKKRPLPTQSLPAKHRGLARHDPPHVEGRAEMAQRAGLGGVDYREPAQSAQGPSRPRRRSSRQGGAPAVSDQRGPGDRAAG